MNISRKLLSRLFLSLFIFSISPIHAALLESCYNDNSTFRNNSKAHEQSAKLWQILINNKAPDIQKALEAYTRSLLKYTRHANIDFQTKEDELLKIFPHSPEHLIAIAETYLTLPNDFKNPAINVHKENFPKSIADTTIYDQNFNKKKALDRFVKAFNLAKQQKKNHLAATIAIRIANILNDESDRFENIISKIFSGELTPIEANPIPREYPPARQKTIYRFQIFQAPATWETAQNDGERILWLLEEAKRLNPKCKNEVALIWANLMRTWFTQQCVPYANDIIPNKDYQIRKNLKSMSIIFRTIPSDLLMTNLTMGEY